MGGLWYQIKSIARDKLCILTFLLPIVVGAAINLLSDMDFSAMNQVTFGIVQQDLGAESVAWLEELGTIAVFRIEKRLCRQLRSLRIPLSE